MIVKRKCYSWSAFSTEHVSLEQQFKASTNITDESATSDWTEAKIINSSSRTGGWKPSWMNALTSDKNVCFRQMLFHGKKKRNGVLCCGWAVDPENSERKESNPSSACLLCQLSTCPEPLVACSELTDWKCGDVDSGGQEHTITTRSRSDHHGYSVIRSECDAGCYRLNKKTKRFRNGHVAVLASVFLCLVVTIKRTLWFMGSLWIFS